MKFAILAPGGIAHKMAMAVKELPEVELYAVGSRNLKRAEEFAKEWGFQKAYGSYEELVSDPEVELVYVASPHSHHYEHTKLCLSHDKHVLVEKAFTVNASQAKELVNMAEEKNLLLVEAMWTRFMPARKILDEIIDGQAIGKITSLTANLGYSLLHKERLVKPELAGGALLDVGVYPIQFALMVAQSRVSKIVSDAVLSEEGVDLKNSITLTFENGIMAVLHSSMLSLTDREGVIYGENGFIKVKNINNCEGIAVYGKDGNLIKEYPIPAQINGYEYEVLACVDALMRGKTECNEMTHADSVYGMELLDQIRKQWEMKYPFELSDK